MKKKLIVVLMFYIMLVLTACAKQEEKASGNRETETSVVVEESTHDTETEEEKNLETENYSAIVIISINPRIKLYVNSGNVVVAAEFLNKDAEEAFQGVELADLTVEQSINKIVEVTVEKNFLTDGKDISIEISDVNEEEFDCEKLCSQVEDAASSAVKQNNIEVNISAKITSTDNIGNGGEKKETTDGREEPHRVLDNETETDETNNNTDAEPIQTVCPDCKGLGAVCSECGGYGIVKCKACNQTGYETCHVCGGAAVINCHGCGGTGIDATSGEACRHCGGSGKITCDACHGSPSKLCTHCGGTLEHTCPVCNGVKNCATCGGTGTVTQ